MNQFLQTRDFELWFQSLKDMKVKRKILSRILSAEHGNFGDCEPVGNGVSEMRIHYGAGYRLYYTRQGEIVYLLLVGGDKSNQKRDIKMAHKMALEL
jgi:putative addiction module killer protein